MGRNKKIEEPKIIEEEKITLVNEEEIENPEIVNSDSDVKTEEVEEPKIIEEEKITLVIDVAFTDKYDNDISYKINDEVPFDKKRANELLSDPRKLVHKK